MRRRQGDGGIAPGQYEDEGRNAKDLKAPTSAGAPGELRLMNRLYPAHTRAFHLSDSVRNQEAAGCRALGRNRCGPFEAT
jgi:hypothetical protein